MKTIFIGVIIVAIIIFALLIFNSLTTLELVKTQDELKASDEIMKQFAIENTFWEMQKDVCPEVYGKYANLDEYDEENLFTLCVNDGWFGALYKQYENCGYQTQEVNDVCMAKATLELTEVLLPVIENLSDEERLEGDYDLEYLQSIKENHQLAKEILGQD